MTSVPAPDFRIAVAPLGGGSLVSLSGELDLATAPEFGSTLREQLAAGPVVLDLAALSFMDSSGLSVLDGAVRSLESDGLQLTIRPQLQPAVRQILELTSMLEVLPFENGAG